MKLVDLDVAGRRVLLRVDYNVPIENGRVVEPKRIEATLPTLKWLLERRTKVIVLSHLGRPKGKWDPKYSLRPVWDSLMAAIRRENLPCVSCGLWDRPFPSAALESKALGMKDTELLLLENLRFSPEEENNGESLARDLSRIGEVFIQEAFGALHRAHASVDALPRMFKSRSFGFLVEKELEVLGRLLASPAKPFVVLLGGLKVSDKIGAIENLLARGVDNVLVGGALAYTFLKAQGISTGSSPVQEDWVERMARFLSNGSGSKRLILSRDHWVVARPEGKAGPRLTDGPLIDAGWGGLDIGPKTLEAFAAPIKAAKTIFWNGPVGVIENPPFDRGSSQMARFIAARTKAGALTVLGGGDTIRAASIAGLDEMDFSHVSTGGGATVEFIEGKALPGVRAILQS